MRQSEETRDGAPLTQKAFENLLTRAAQPMREPESPPAVERTSESQSADD